MVGFPFCTLGLAPQAGLGNEPKWWPWGTLAFLVVVGVGIGAFVKVR